MAESINPATAERAKSTYLNRDRSVNLRQHLDEQKRMEESGLENIEIRDTVKSLGKDDFLKILVTQLSHQDPTQPMKDQEFVAQMAQFSSLEQMQNISRSISRMANRDGMNMVGRFVMGHSRETGEGVSGVVQAVLFDESGGVNLKVGRHTVALDGVSMVSDPSYIREEYGGKASSAPVPAPAAPVPASAVPEVPSATRRPDDRRETEHGTASPVESTGEAPGASNSVREGGPVSLYDLFGRRGEGRNFQA